MTCLRRGALIISGARKLTRAAIGHPIGGTVMGMRFSQQRQAQHWFCWSRRKRLAMEGALVVVGRQPDEGLQITRGIAIFLFCQWCTVRLGYLLRKAQMQSSSCKRIVNSHQVATTAMKKALLT
ncbi:hypothetical protein Efla_007653 [Eimeria flavescens]